MQRARRLASVAVIATLAVSGLSACRSAPDVAVYFGSTEQISVAEVERILDDARDKLTAAQAAALKDRPAESAPPVRLPITASDVVGALVSREVGKSLAPGKPAQGGTPDLNALGQLTGLPADAEYVKLYSDGYGTIAGIAQNAKPGKATEEDLRFAYEASREAGEVAPQVTFESWKEGLSPQSLEVLGLGIAARDALRDQVKKLDIEVNPRFSAADIDVFAVGTEKQRLLALVVLPLVDPATMPVTDAR
jgi:hypothetical protein